MGIITFSTIGAFAFVLLAGFTAAVQAGDVAKAKRDLAYSKDNAESGRWDDLDSGMKKVAADMEGLSDAEKAPLLAEIAEIKAIVTKSIEDEVTKRLDKVATDDPVFAKSDIERATKRLDADEVKAYADPAAIAKLRARIASLSGGSTPTPAPTTPTPTTPTPTVPKASMSEDLAGATTHAGLAHNMFEQGDRGAADSQIKDVMRFLAKVPEADKAAILADMAALSKQIDEADLKARLAEELRRVDSKLHRYVYDAKDSIREGIQCYSDRIDKADQLLASNDVHTYMPADRIQKYQAEIDALRVKLTANNKAAALSRHVRYLKELEEKLATDPFKGVDERKAYDVFTDLKALSMRAHKEFVRVPMDDPDIKAALARIIAADAKIAAASGKWSIQKTEQDFSGGWKITSQSFAGWETESLSPDSAAERKVEGLPKTREAIASAVYWLNSADTKQTIEQYKDNAIVKDTANEARKTLFDASTKLNEAFNVVLADMEHQPMPKREADRAHAGYLANDAAHWFAGTKYMDANIARATALDAKWKTDVARAEKEMEETLKKLTAQADVAWLRIEASAGAEKGFDPSQAGGWTGKTIILKGYYNRSGWDFDGAYDFAVGIKGIPVAGKYDANVREAFAEGSRHTQFGINDHIGWDVIAVVEGPGEIKRRTITEVKDANTHELIMKVEKYVAEPCVVIKIIGLHAGPVAVGPK